MSTFVVLVVLGAGLLVGIRLNSASEAHAYFSHSRSRLSKVFGEWMRQLVRATVGVIGLLVLLYLVFFQLPQV
ncbi:hypothetical protein AB0I60_20005 [Actinosynnema sp. NPDC050436]|uniref:hypothetical protein n=1 Tax=Actinosynnema sp. NPDC050436 TaxID=3155659 RepID=UPI00340B0D9D